jgi:endonuclease/exonuclease/phosphatase family metal-dependent hydrolase
MPLLSGPGAASVANNPNNGFGIVTYNVLAKSLGTNMIPWVMDVSPSIQKRILEQQQQQQQAYSSNTNKYPSFDRWVDARLKPEYMTHFHKNFDSGNYARMREFWGCHHLTSAADIPEELNQLRFVDEDCVSYNTISQQGEESSVTARTLRGVAKEVLSGDDPNLFEDFLQDVIGLEERVFSWNVRGPRIFQTIFGVNDVVSKEEQQQKQQQPPPYPNTADIIALQEYDFHNVVANYRGTDDDDDDETFAQAMACMDYDGAFFKDPLQGKYPPSGLGVFWNKHVFETVTKVEGIESLECCCDKSGFQGAAANYDLQEKWHSIKNNNSNDNNNKESELLKPADRRNAGFCRLRHKATGKIVTVCATHLMTTSRDGPKTNRFPGEVRAGEIARIRKLVQEFCCHQEDNDDALLLVGDLNTDAKDAKTVFGGEIMSSSYGNDDPPPPPLMFDTGFNAATSSFQWGSRSMVDAFEHQHQWGTQEDEDDDDDDDAITSKKKKKYCSSRNASRIEWIDYVFYDQHRLKCHHVAESLVRVPPTQIPNEIHPSDHLPLFASFEFK